MGQGESGFSGCRLGLPQLSPTGGWLFFRLPTLPLACFLAPYPPAPSRREGGILSFLMQGAPPLAFPGAESGRHLQPLPCRASGGGLSSSPPADPAFSLLSCPLSPFPPFPRRGRGILSFLMQGASPLASPGAEPGGTYSPFQAGHPAGAGFLPRLPTLPLACFLAPSLCPFPAGRGILSFLMQGAPPLASPGAEPGGTYSPCHAGHPAGDGFRIPADHGGY